MLRPFAVAAILLVFLSAACAPTVGSEPGVPQGMPPADQSSPAVDPSGLEESADGPESPPPGASSAPQDVAIPDLQEPPITETGDVYFLGDYIPVPVKTGVEFQDFTLEWVLHDRDGIAGEIYTGVGPVVTFDGLGRVALLPTSMVVKKGVYFLSGQGIERRRILLVDPVPQIADPLTWPFGLITSTDKIDQGAPMAEEFYRVGIRWFHFDYPIGEPFYFDWPYSINAIGASSDPEAGRISPGFESFINRSDELGLNPVFKLMAHYEQISGPGDPQGDFYTGLRKIQDYYAGKIGHWMIGNEVEGGGYSVFTPGQYAAVIKNMAASLKSVDPDVKIIAGEFYSAPNQHLTALLGAGYRDTWDVLSGHKVVGNARVSEYLQSLGGLDRPIWDTEANGTIFGGPSEWNNYQQSRFPIVYNEDEHGGIQKHIARSFCLETRFGDKYVPAYFNPDEPCIGASLFIAMHYNANWEPVWALRRHFINDFDQPSEQNHKVAAFRTVTDMLYGAEPLTRIPDLEAADPYGSPESAEYVRADGYIFRYGPEYMLMLWSNAGHTNFDFGELWDRELVLTTDPQDEIVLYDSLGVPYPLENAGGRVKVWVSPDVVYLRGFSQIPTFDLDESGPDDPYFVTAAPEGAVVGRTYLYNAWAFDSDVPTSGDDALPRITYSLVDAPPGMELAVAAADEDGQKRAALLMWTPDSPGAYTVTLRAVSDHGPEAAVEQTFTIEVLPAGTDAAPHFLSRPTTRYARLDYVWWYNANAHDPDGDLLTYALVEAPQGMAIDPRSGFIQWIPSQAGEFDVVVSAADGSSSTLQAFTLKVAPGLR